MTGKYFSYLSPKLENRPHEEEGRLRRVCPQADLRKVNCCRCGVEKFFLWMRSTMMMENFTQLILQIEDGFYLMTPSMEPSDCFNHSCDPNAGLSGQIGLVAMRDIEPGEEICLDYAMCDGSNYDEFDCQCGSPNCRGRVTGEDWKRPELWERYEGYFSPYLQRRIAALKKEVHQKQEVLA